MAFTTTTGANGVVSLVGTSGVDTAFITALQKQVFIGAQAANDIVTVNLQDGTALVSAYSVNGGSGNDTLSFADSVTGSLIQGDGGDGTGGNDTIAFTGATVSSSNIEGGVGNDNISNTGQLNNTTFNGNQGVDTFTLGGPINSSFVFGGQGSDIMNVGAAGAPIGSFIDSTINGNREGDTITVFASIVTDSTIFGGQGNDTITATLITAAGAVPTTGAGFVISGDLGNDVLTGSGRTDSISGGEGTDTITGGLQNDTMTGGAGSDTFVTAAGASTAASSAAGLIITYANGVDVVTDFNGGAVASGGDVLSGTGALANAAVQVAAVAGANFYRGIWNGTTFTVGAAGADLLFATTTLNAAGFATAASDSVVLQGGFSGFVSGTNSIA